MRCAAITMHTGSRDEAAGAGAVGSSAISAIADDIVTVSRAAGSCSANASGGRGIEV